MKYSIDSTNAPFAKGKKKKNKLCSAYYSSASCYYPSDWMKLSPDDRQPRPLNCDTSKVTTLH